MFQPNMLLSAALSLILVASFADSENAETSYCKHNNLDPDRAICPSCVSFQFLFSTFGRTMVNLQEGAIEPADGTSYEIVLGDIVMLRSPYDPK